MGTWKNYNFDSLDDYDPSSPRVRVHNFDEVTLQGVHIHVDDAIVKFGKGTVHGVDEIMSREEFEFYLKCRAAAVFLCKLRITPYEFCDSIIPGCRNPKLGHWDSPGGYYINKNGPCLLFDEFWAMIQKLRDRWINDIFQPLRMGRVWRYNGHDPSYFTKSTMLSEVFEPLAQYVDLDHLATIEEITRYMWPAIASQLSSSHLYGPQDPWHDRAYRIDLATSTAGKIFMKQLSAEYIRLQQGDFRSSMMENIISRILMKPTFDGSIYRGHTVHNDITFLNPQLKRDRNNHVNGSPTHIINHDTYNAYPYNGSAEEFICRKEWDANKRKFEYIPIKPVRGGEAPYFNNHYRKPALPSIGFVGLRG